MTKTTYYISIPILVFCSSLNAQEMKAGNISGDEMSVLYEQLLSKCDNMDAIVLRGKIRVEIQRSTADAKEKANLLMKEGLEACARGDDFSAVNKLQEGYDIIKSGSLQKFGSKNTESSQDANIKNVESKNPWYKFW